MKTKEFLPFYLTDLDAVARHFEEKAAEGLMLKSFSNTCEYEPCEPKKLRFNVVLCPVKGSENEKINDGSRDFIGLCEEAGWRFVDHRGSVYVFCCENEDVPDIMTDEMERVEAVENAGKRNLLTTLLFGLLTGVQIYLYSNRAFDPGEDRVKSICFAGFFAVELILFVCTMILSRRNERRWREQAIKAIEAGEPIPPSDGNVLKKRKVTAVIFMAVLAAAILALLASAFISAPADTRCYLAALLVSCVPFVFALKAIAKRKRAGKRIVLPTIGAILGWVVLQIVLFAILGEIFHVFDAIE